MIFKLIFVLICLIETSCNGLHSRVGVHSRFESKSCGLRKTENETDDQSVSSRIVNGLNVSLGEFPWIALIYSRRMSGDEYFEYYCGGALISDRYVVTAANCFIETELTPGASLVIAGTIDRSSDRHFSYVKDIIIHEQFSRSDPKGRLFDICLVELTDDELRPQFMSGNEDKNYVINTVCLPERNVTNNGEEGAIFSAFGEVDPNYKPENLPNVLLKKADYRLEDNSKCDPRQVCARESVNPSCWGDTGSPLVQFDGERAVLIGILVTVGNQSSGCTQNRQYFTRVSYFVDWINDKITNSTEVRRRAEESNDSSSHPSLILLIVLLAIVVSGSICLAVFIFKLKRDSDQTLQI